MAINPVRPFVEVEQINAANLDVFRDEASKQPYHVAIILDGVVQEVFHTSERVAALLLSSPTIVQCASPNDGGPEISWLYNSTDGSFTTP